MIEDPVIIQLNIQRLFGAVGTEGSYDPTETSEIFDRIPVPTRPCRSIVILEYI
jgi:hypothetical protein